MVSHAALKTLELLRRPDSTGYNPQKMCHPDTRHILIKEIMSFISSRADQEQSNIFLLTGVAGSGKTAIAHTIAHQCVKSDPPMLAAAFFFDREVKDRNNSDLLISTIALNLSATDRAVAEAIVAAVDQDRSIVSASLERQFEELVLKPSELLANKGPMAFIIDALDESSDEGFLKVVARFSELPRNISIIVTCRDTPSILNTLNPTGNRMKVRRIDLQDAQNIADVKVFAEDRLQEVVKHSGSRRHIDARLVMKFVDRAEGLFIWTATVCDILRNVVQPLQTLEDILSHQANSPATSKMDLLYASILNDCPWDDTHFLAAYRKLISAMMVLRSPLSADAMERLLNLDSASIKSLLRPISALVTGLGPDGGPMRFAHQSFREYITTTGASDVDSRFTFAQVDLEAAEEEVGAGSLRALGSMLPGLQSQIGYVDRTDRAAHPTLSGVSLPPGFSYVSRHWQSHLASIKKPSDELFVAVLDFASKHLESWIDCSPSIGNYQTLTLLRSWSKVCR